MVAGATELLRGGEASGAGADDGNFFSGARFRGFGANPPFEESSLDNVFFVLLDGDWRRVDAENARGFAGGGADAAGEFGKIISRVQSAHGFAPAVAIDQVVPVGDEVVERAAGVAEGDAAIHAAGGLGFDFRVGEVLVDFEIVVDAVRDGAAGGDFAFVF